MYVQPANGMAVNSPQYSMVTNPGMGISIDAASSFEEYYVRGIDTFFYGPIALVTGPVMATGGPYYGHAVSINPITAANVIAASTASYPINVLESTIQSQDSAIAMNDTYVLNPQGLAFDHAFELAVYDQMSMYLPNLKSISAYLPVDEGFTLVGPEYVVNGGAGYYLCQNYAYYTIQVLWNVTFVWGNPSSLNFQVSPTIESSYTYSGPLSTGQACTYYTGLPP